MQNNFWTWFWTGFWMTGWNQNFTAPTKQQKFPWLSDDQIKRLESLTSDPQEQQKLYKQALQLIQQKNINDNRIAAENEMEYKSMNEKDTKQKNYMQSNVRLEQLADLTKKKFWLNADADTQGVINWLMQYAQDKGVSMDSLNDYLAWYNERFLYDTGLKEESTAHKIWQVATDIVGWAYDSATSLARRWAKGLANVVWWTAKQLWADEAKTDELVQGYKDYLDNERSGKSIWADQESLTYNISKWVWDFAQVMAGEWLLKAWVQSTAKGAELMKYLEKAPTWQKMVAGGLEWAGDMALFSIVSENKLPTTTEEAIGAGLWAVIPWAWAVYKATKPVVKKALNKTASQLELSGLLNPAKLNAIKDQLVKEWTDLAEAWLKGWKAEDVGTWMIERGFKWDKPTIIKDLWTHAEKSHALKREVLWASNTLHDVESARKSLQVIHDTIKDVPWLEQKLARVEELMAKEKHTLSELDEIKSILDDTKSIYTLAGDAKAWAVNKGLDKVRKDLRKYIEDAATEEWLGNVKLLNNETQIAKWLQDAISRKDSADMAREMLGVFSKTAIGWAAWYNVWPFDTNTLWGKVWNVIIWALAGKYLFSTKAKTSLASYINKMSGGSKKELERLIAGDLSVKKLSKKTQNELAKAFEESGIMEAGVPTEMTQAEYEALLKNYSKSDLPALEFKEWVNDAWKNILAGDSEKIIATPEWVNFREWQVAELPTQNVNYSKVDGGADKTMASEISKDEIKLTPAQIDKISRWELDSESASQLVALHNLNLEKLRKTTELWWMPMPSIAVTKRWIPHEDYGDITLVMKKSAVDPKASRSNKLHILDGYTPEVPQPIVKLKNTKEADNIVKQIQKETWLSYGEIDQWIEYRDNFEYHHPEMKKYSKEYDQITDKKLWGGFTDSWQRRYKDYNLDNIVKAMKENKEDAYNWQFGKLVAQYEWEVKNIDKLRTRGYWPKEWEKWDKLFNEYYDEAGNLYQKVWWDVDSFQEMWWFEEEIARLYDRDTNKWLSKIREENNFKDSIYMNIEKSDLDKLNGIIKEWADIPRPYSEAKPERAVKFDEVNYVLAPEEQAAEVESLLWDKVQVVPYKASEWRASKLEELQKKYGNVFFGIWWSIFPISYLLGGNWDNETENIMNA